MSETKTIKTESVIERAIERRADAPLPSSTAEAARGREGPPIPEQPSDIPVAEPMPGTAPAAKEITVDLRRLESQGIFSPDRAPNRTTEEFRLIKRTVRLNVQAATEAQSKNPNLIMVTSSHQGEGKSFVSLNLALSLAAETDATVLLIDADPSRASVISHLGVKVEKGLLDLLRDEDLGFSDVVLRTNIKRLTILPAGYPDPLSSELLAGSTAAHLLEEISQRYPDRIVILDAPPVLATTETTALALHAGQIIFVVDSRKTTKSAIKESLNLISTCPNIGFVLNRAEPQIGSERFGSYYNYYTKSYKKYYKSAPR